MSQSHSNVQGHIHEMRDLLQEILEIQRTTQNADEGLRRTQEIVKESSRMVEDSTCPNEIMVDAKILHVGSNLINTNVSSLTTNLITFDEDRYIREILNRVQSVAEMPEEDREWKCLAPFTYHLFKKSVPITFMLGPLSLKPLSGEEEEREITKEKRRVERQKKTEEKQKKTLTSQTDLQETEDQGSDVYEHILKCLVREYKKNDRKPISYFNFIVDPSDYWTTIQNIFHFAFLVRDGTVKMTLQDGVPFVQPVSRKSEERTSQKTQNSQFCLTLSVDEWEKLIDKYQVNSSCIPPFVKN